MKRLGDDGLLREWPEVFRGAGMRKPGFVDPDSEEVLEPLLPFFASFFGDFEVTAGFLSPKDFLVLLDFVLEADNVFSELS